MSEYKFELNLKQNTITSEIDKSISIGYLHNLLHNLDFEHSGHTGFASEKELHDRYPVSLNILQDEQTGVVTIEMLNTSGDVIDTKTLDLNTEKIIKNVLLDYEHKSIIFELTDSTTISCDISELIDTFTSHTNDTSNPHNVTKEQLGLNEVDNTSDINKPVSTAQQEAINQALSEAKEYTDTDGGKIDSISVNHVELPIDENKNVNIDIPTKSSDLLNDDFTVKDSTYKHITVTESAVSDGSTTFNKYDDTNIKSKIEEINNKIPNQASSENKLADKGFVNSSIATNTASFLGSYDLVLDLALLEVASNEDIAIKLNETINTKTNNDYCYVYITDYVSGKIKEYRRFKYSELESTFKYEYTLNNSSYTQEQWDAINSGITADNLNSLNNHVSNSDNPHNVTKSQVGLSNVDNTSDADKPISNAQAIVNASLLNKIEESAIYTNSSPTTIEVGGIKKGTTFDNMKLTDIIENLLYPYVKFTFSSITLSSGTTFEYGTIVNVSYVRLNYEKGSKELTNVSIMDEGGNSLYNGEVSSKINITKQYDGTTGGTISATLTDGVNEIPRSSSISYKYYNYYTLSSEETAPTTATKTTNDSAENVYSYETGQYLYLYDRDSNKKIQTNVLGQWADVNTTNLGPIELNLASGITAEYYVYRTDKFTARDSARYRLY